MRRYSALLTLSILLSCLQIASAAIITFNVSANAPGDPIDDVAAEAVFMDVLSVAGYHVFDERFTGTQWDSVRSSITLGTHSATNIVSKGIDWHSSVGDFITTSAINSDNQAPWQIYSKETATGGLHAVPATIIGDSTQTLYGVGMWVSGSFGGKLNMIFDGNTANPVSFKRITGYENNDPNEPIKESIFLDSSKQFFGVIVTEGFQTFQLLETEGVPEDQKLMWASKFKFATAVPEPSSLPVSTAALFGLLGIRRRKIQQ